MEETISKPLRYTKRWFAYFDLLGFANLVRHHEIETVLPIYESVLEAITIKAESQKGISYSWFSDTFILFTKGSSDEEFALLEHVARLFFQKLILSKIPVRGSLTVGPLYTQQRKNIFIGEALIDAYEYGEKQNWLGFILTPSVYEHLKESSLHMDRRAFYRQVNTLGVINHRKSDNVYAFAFNNGSVNGENIYLQAISEMRHKADAKYQEKYINTENFIRQHSRNGLNN